MSRYSFFPHLFDETGLNDMMENSNPQVQLLQQEIGDLEIQLEEKLNQMESAVNPIMKKRFESLISNLQSQLDEKNRQLHLL